MVSDQHDASSEFVSSLWHVYDCLQYDHANAHGTVLLEHGGRSFLGVRIGLEDVYDPRDLRQDIETMLQVSNGAFIEVVGDSSGGYNPSGIVAIHAALSEAAKAARTKRKMPIIEYGYTANRHDLNWVVNDWLLSPDSKDVKAVGNIVSASATAVEEWNCKASERVNHFVLAYSPTGTGFGEDVWVSDSVLFEGACDFIICAEGGPQAFYQVATVCTQGVRATAITGPDMRKAGPTRFSAAFLLKILHDRFHELCSQDALSANVQEKLQRSALEYISRDGSLTTSQAGGKHQLITRGLQKFLESPMSLARITVQRI